MKEMPLKIPRGVLAAYALARIHERERKMISAKFWASEAIRGYRLHRANHPAVSVTEYLFEDSIQEIERKEYAR
jgi:hypothetical protein